MDIKNGITHSHDVRANKEYADWIYESQNILAQMNTVKRGIDDSQGLY